MPTQSRTTVRAGTATAALTAHAAEPRPQECRRRNAVIAGPRCVAGVLAHPVCGDATGLVQASAQPACGVRTGWGDHAIGACSGDDRRTGAHVAAHSVIAGKEPGATAADGRGIRYGDPLR